MTRSVLALSILALTAALGAGCSSPSAPALVKEETVCPSFEQGGQKMRGGLKKPVRLRVLEGEDVVATVMLYGVPDERHPTRFKLPDKDEEYSLEFAQCTNERAPHPEETKSEAKGSSAYVCNEPAVYQTLKHSTKRGEASSMELPFPAPPDVTCWRGTSAAPAASAASASAAPSAEPAPSASAEPAPSASAEPAPSASAEAALSASAAPSASAPR
jgi:hypothetical protein